MPSRSAMCPRWIPWHLDAALRVVLVVEAGVVLCIPVGLITLFSLWPAPLTILDLLFLSGLMVLDLCATGLVALAFWISCKR